MTQPTTPEGEMGGPFKNTDRELWREREGDFYSPKLFVTQGGGIGMDVGGTVIVQPIREWHKLALSASPSPPVGGGSSAETCKAQSHARQEPVAQAVATMSDRLFRVALLGFVPDDDEHVIAEANDQIDRMRAALLRLLRLGEEGMKPNYEEWLTFHEKVAQMAREGLADPIEPPPPDAHGAEPSKPEAVMPAGLVRPVGWAKRKPKPDGAGWLTGEIGASKAPSVAAEIEAIIGSLEYAREQIDHSNFACGNIDKAIALLKLQLPVDHSKQASD